MPPFVSLEDFLVRVPEVNRKHLEAMAKAGALDSICPRNALLCEQNGELVLSGWAEDTYIRARQITNVPAS